MNKQPNKKYIHSRVRGFLFNLDEKLRHKLNKNYGNDIRARWWGEGVEEIDTSLKCETCNRYVGGKCKVFREQPCACHDKKSLLKRFKERL